MRHARSAEAFVSGLYQIGLGRAPDPDGLAAWACVMRDTGDPTLVLQGLLNIVEYRAQAVAKGGLLPECRALPAEALAQMRRWPHIVDVGAQSLGEGTHSYSPLLDITPSDIIDFDPLGHRIAERHREEGGPGLRLLPHVIADGQAHTLRINNEDGTSSLFPLNTCLTKQFNHLASLRTVASRLIVTKRLDDVLEQGPVDLLKLDIQGAELMALRGASRRLEETAAIHCEVGFQPIYLGQPLFGDIHAFLVERGFVLIDLLIPGRYHHLVPPGRQNPDRLLWADAVYFRAVGPKSIGAAQALLAAAMYRKTTLAEALLGPHKAALQSQHPG
jgi:FkbM family methyltransferase